MFHLDQFISQYVTKRPVSMFSADIEANRDALSEKIAGKSVLVIGGAGSIGSWWWWITTRTPWRS